MFPIVDLETIQADGESDQPNRVMNADKEGSDSLCVIVFAEQQTRTVLGDVLDDLEGVIDGPAVDSNEAPISVARSDLVKVIFLAKRFDFLHQRSSFIQVIDYANKRGVQLQPVV